MPRPDTLRSALTEAAAALKQGDYARAQRILDALPSGLAGHPDRLHLLGLTHKTAGRLKDAENTLRQSLQAQPRQPAVLANLGNVYKAQGRLDAAEQAYRQALALDDKFFDAWKNLGLLLAAASRDEEASQILEQAAGRNARDPAIWTTLGQCYRRLGDFDRSCESFHRALAVRPQHANALAGLGQTLRMMGRPEDAAGCFDKVHELGAATIEVLVARADVAADQGRYDEAVARYQAVLEHDPQHTAAHVQLSEVLWQTGAESTYGGSFRRALEQYPDNPQLLAAWCEGLANTGAGDEALRQLQARPSLVERYPLLLAARARRQAAHNNVDKAAESFRQALELTPDDANLSLDFAQFAIYCGDYEDALAALRVTERHRPDDQLLWACRGLCWRLLGDDRAAWLNDDALLVGAYEIRPPARYGNLSAFLDAVAESLDELHRTQAAPAHQSLRGGTQTAARLFYRPEKVIQDLRVALSEAVQRYIGELPDDSHHPMLRRRSRRFQFAGSWSVRLRSGGYHVNHVHPQGWISSSHYITVPAQIGTDRTNPAGWLKFGESGLTLGDREVISSLVKPEPGTVVLFPSYFWHGTVPFDSPEPRITTPFDVTPMR